MSDLLQRESAPSKEDTVSTDDTDSASSSHPILQLTCGICKARYTDPRLLPCLHSFCNICIKTLDSFVIQGSNVGEKGRPKSVVLCPTCNSESVLPTSGSGDFPVDFLLQKALLYDALDPHSGNLTCDLCTDDAKALSRCVECMVNICGFCCQAHKRQKKTASHTVLSFLEARRHSAKQLQCPVYCSKHQQEELKFYCETCDHSVCRDCCLVEHRDHLVEYVEDVGTHHKKVLSSLLSRLEPHIEAVKRGIESSDRLEVAIAERSASIKVDIEDHFEAYIQALHKHKRSLLQSVTQISSSRTKAVQSQKLQFQQILGDLQHTYDITSTALQDGTNTEILSIKPTLSQRLCDLLRVSYQSAPSLQEASLQFKAKAVSESSNPFHIRGIISTSTAEPSQTFAEGEGLSRARVGEETTVTVVALDENGERLKEGGDDIQSDIRSAEEPSRKFECFVQDRGDGTYKLSYCLKAMGPYILHIKIAGQHIKGSPFGLNVRTPWKNHTGIWHCCAFCSSEGSKEATCACGGMMPGGFKGCGHNHVGHPGSWHWSCCALTVQDSVCSSVEPVIRSPNQERPGNGRLQRRATFTHSDRLRMLQQQNQSPVGGPQGTMRGKGESMSRLRDPSPMRLRDPSPMRLREPSPMRLRDPSPMRMRDPSPMRLRDPSPMRIRDASPLNAGMGQRVQYAQSVGGTGPSLTVDAKAWKNVSF